MQSEEEIINNIKTMLEKNDEIFDEVGTDLYFSKPTAEVIQGLLDLYNKEKEKNTHLELCLKSEEMYSEGLNRDIKSLLNIEPNNNFISKDKIREILDKYAMTEITEYDNVVKFYKEIKNLVEGDTNE